MACTGRHEDDPGQGQRVPAPGHRARHRLATASGEQRDEDRRGAEQHRRVAHAGVRDARVLKADDRAEANRPRDDGAALKRRG